MAKNMRELIEYYGIENESSEIGELFKQVELETYFSITDNKPNIEHIIKVWGEAKVIEQKIIKVPKGTSLEGEINTGYKLRVVGEVQIKIQYTTDEAVPSIFSTKGTQLFCTYLTLPGGIGMLNYIYIHLKLQDLMTNKINPRTLHSNINLLVIGESIE